MDIDSVLKSHGIGIGGSNIKSIQTIKTNDIGAVLTKNFTISAVDVTKTMVFINQIHYNSASQREAMCGVKLINSTTVQLIKGSAVASTGTPTYIITIIEFNNVKSFQSGSAVGAGLVTEQNITISPINAAKSIIFASTYNVSTAQSYVQVLCGYEILNSTTIGLFGASSDTTILWQVIEFN